MTGARAPGDADSLCSDELQSVSLPANARVLMDSNDYILLLPRADGGVWQQVDLDDNNSPGRGTEVISILLGIGHHGLVLNFSGVRTATFLADRQ